MMFKPNATLDPNPEGPYPHDMEGSCLGSGRSGAVSNRCPKTWASGRFPGTKRATQAERVVPVGAFVPTERVTVSDVLGVAERWKFQQEEIQRIR